MDATWKFFWRMIAPGLLRGLVEWLIEMVEDDDPKHTSAALKVAVDARRVAVQAFGDLQDIERRAAYRQQEAAEATSDEGVISAAAAWRQMHADRREAVNEIEIEKEAAAHAGRDA